MATDGKAFESHFETICNNQNINIIRFYDVTNGYKKVDNPADFVISISAEKPSILVECKAVNSKKSFSIDFRQLDRLLNLPLFNSFVVIWFVQDRRILAFRSTEMGRLREAGIKSINPNNLKGIEYIDLNPVYKRINPESLEVSKLWKLN